VEPKKDKLIPNGAGLMDLAGILADAYRQLGGGEAYLRAERAAWGPDAWERYTLEEKARVQGEPPTTPTS